MLSVDESPAAFLQNSIKNDHCYTNLLPSSDPNGPSFFVADVRSNSSDISKGKGKVVRIMCSLCLIPSNSSMTGLNNFYNFQFFRRNLKTL